MKKIWLIIVLCIFITGCNSASETGGKAELEGDNLKSELIFYGVEEKISNNNEFDKESKISEIDLTEENINNLTILGKTWGFLKYYHPYIVKDQYNWDYELFRVLPAILDAENLIDRDKILYSWIESQGEFEISDEEKQESTNIKVEPDLNWILDSDLNDELVEQLTNIKNGKRRDRNNLIEIDPYTLAPEFKSENPYAEMDYPDAGYRLLSLYRYWNIIEYYFPYKYLIGEDWDNVLTEFIPKFINAENELEYELVVLELITRINDSHAIIEDSQILDNYWGKDYLPIKVAFVENKLVVIDYYNEELGKQSGLKIGDIVTKINNSSVEDIINEMEPYTPSSNEPTKLRNIARDILRTNESSLKIDFIHNDENLWLEVDSYPKEVLNSDIKAFNRRVKSKYQDDYFKVINSDIAYIYPGLMKMEYIPEIMREIEDTKGLIIDLRCYPLESIFGLEEYLFPKSIGFVKNTVASVEEPGLFSMGDIMKVGTTNNNHYKGKLVIIIDEISQSQSEFVTMAFRKTPNATVIGSNSAGADGSVSYFHLPGNIYTRITGIGVYYPDGGETQRIGIIPDIEIKPTIQGIKAGSDELLEKAIEIINEE